MLKRNRELSQFGMILGSLLALLVGLLLPWLNHKPVPTWPWLVATALLSAAAIAPTLLRPLFWVWMRLAGASNWLVTRVVLGVVFYGVILPFGLAMRLFGKDPLQQDSVHALKSYRVPSHKQARDHMERPF